MSSAVWLLLVRHRGGYTPAALQRDVLLQVVVAAASRCCESYPSVAIPA